MPDDAPLGGEPPISSRFLLEVDGVEIGVFLEVTGLEVSVDVVEYTEGGVNGYVRKFPAVLNWPNLVFRRGLTDNDALFDWLGKSSGEGFAANASTLTRSTGAVTILGQGGQRLRAWDIVDVFPVRWVGPRLTSESSLALYEELEVAHHGFQAKQS